MKILVDQLDVEECPFRVANVCWFPAVFSNEKYGIPCQTTNPEDSGKAPQYWNECQFFRGLLRKFFAE